MRRFFSLLFALVAFALGGCASDPVGPVLSAVSGFVSETDPQLRTLYETQQSLCLGLPNEADCITTTREAWAPVIARLQEIRALWCAATPSAPDCLSTEIK